VVKSAIVAFFGRSGQVLHAVGAYVVPKSCWRVIMEPLLVAGVHAGQSLLSGVK
jgi:hypothetical protein